MQLLLLLLLQVERRRDEVRIKILDSQTNNRGEQGYGGGSRYGDMKGYADCGSIDDNDRVEITVSTTRGQIEWV
jgi:hypothetical protein